MIADTESTECTDAVSLLRPSVVPDGYFVFGTLPDVDDPFSSNG